MSFAIIRCSRRDATAAGCGAVVDVELWPPGDCAEPGLAALDEPEVWSGVAGLRHLASQSATEERGILISLPNRMQSRARSRIMLRTFEGEQLHRSASWSTVSGRAGRSGIDYVHLRAHPLNNA